MQATTSRLSSLRATLASRPPSDAETSVKRSCDSTFKKASTFYVARGVDTTTKATLLTFFIATIDLSVMMVLHQGIKNDLVAMRGKVKKMLEELHI